ncbi:hypothetical protein LguiB_036383 [Lonicera macranthoides]
MPSITRSTPSLNENDGYDGLTKESGGAFNMRLLRCGHSFWNINRFLLHSLFRNTYYCLPCLPNLSSLACSKALGSLRLGKYTEWFNDVFSSDISNKCEDALNLLSETHGCKEYTEYAVLVNVGVSA